MRKKYIEQINEDGSHRGALRQISEWSTQNSNMKFYEVEELERHPLGLLAFETHEDYTEQYLLGHVAITEVSEINEQKFARIGALVVNKAYQSNGVATALVGKLLDAAPEALPNIDGYYAFVHPGSLKAFLSNGAEVIGSRDPAVATGCDIIVGIEA